MNVNSVRFNEVLKNFEKLTSPYSGKKLTPEETKKMVEHLTIRPRPAGACYNMHKITKEEKINLKKYLDGLDKLIAKRPNDVELRKYREIFIKKLDEI